MYYPVWASDRFKRHFDALSTVAFALGRNYRWNEPRVYQMLFGEYWAP